MSNPIQFVNVPPVLDGLTIPQLVALYNQLSGKPPIKKFETKGAALKRVAPLHQLALMAQATEQPKSERKPRESLSAKICELIRGGYTNAAIAEKLGLDTKRAHYPGWNRAMMKRTGQI